MAQHSGSSAEHRSLPRCVICEKEFKPHPNVKDRQVTCGELSCRVDRRISQQARWRKDNPSYFCGRYDYVKGWRQRHPDYQQKWRAQRKALDQAQRKSLIDPVAREIQSQLSHIKTEETWEQVFSLSEIQLQLTTQLNKTLSRIVLNRRQDTIRVNFQKSLGLT